MPTDTAEYQSGLQVARAASDVATALRRMGGRAASRAELESAAAGVSGSSADAIRAAIDEMLQGGQLAREGSALVWGSKQPQLVGSAYCPECQDSKPETGQVVAPPTKFRADQNPDGTWNLRDVPVFVEHDVHDKTGGRSYKVDRSWMGEAVSKSQTRYREDGYLAPLHENHHGRGREVKLLGRYLLTGVKRMPYQGRARDVTFADYLRLQPETYERIKRGELPYRSAEVLRLDAREIDSIALLADEVPFFRLAPHEVAEEKRHASATRFSDDSTPLVAYRATGALSYSLLMRYDDMPVEEKPPVVEVPGEKPGEKPEKMQGEEGGVVSLLSEIARLIQEAIEAAKGGGAAPEAAPSAAPAPVEPAVASAMRAAPTDELLRMTAKVDAMEARYSAIERQLVAEKQATERRGAVGKVFDELRQYGLGEDKHRAKLQAIADKDGIPALHAYAAAIKEYAAAAPPSFAYLAGGDANGRPHGIATPDVGAEKYAAHGPQAVELAYKAGRDFDDLKRKGVPLGMSRDEFIGLTLEGEGGIAMPTSATGG